MATEIRPELSEKNPYWIGKHRYYELKHFCLQYPIWKKAYNALLGLSSRPNDLDIFVKSGQVRSDPTARCAESRVSFAKRMELVEQAAIGTDGDLYPYILRGVTEGLSYPRPLPYRCWRRWPQGCCFPRKPSRTYTIAGSAPPADSPVQAAFPRDAA